MTQEEKYMKEAIRQAKKAAAVGDVPIGCVIVHEDKIIARAYNQRNKKKTMYITLEPCQMCAGAIVQARIPKVVIGAMNPKAGCAGSVLNILQVERFNHQTEIEHGILEEECSQMLSDFFREVRRKKKEEKNAQN